MKEKKIVLCQINLYHNQKAKSYENVKCECVYGENNSHNYNCVSRKERKIINISKSDLSCSLTP